jgi:hypothetical protein
MRVSTMRSGNPTSYAEPNWPSAILASSSGRFGLLFNDRRVQDFVDTPNGVEI